MHRPHLSPAESRILEQCWSLGACSVREILERLPGDEQVAYTTVETLVMRLEAKGALRKVKKIGNAQIYEAAIERNDLRSNIVRELLDLFGAPHRLLVSELIDSGAITLKDLKALQEAAASKRGGKRRA